MRPENIRPDLEQFARDHFAFLVEEKGFRPGPEEKTGWYTTISYLGERIGFDIQLEFYDNAVITGLINVQGGAAQNADSAAAPAQRRRRPFFGALLKDLNVTDQRIDQVYALGRTSQPWDSQTFEAIIRLDSGLVRDYIDALGQLPTETLFPPPASKGPARPRQHNSHM